MQKSIGLAAAILLLPFLFVSCAQGSDSSQSGQVVFSVGPVAAKIIQADAADDLDGALSLEIELSGGVTQKKTVSVSSQEGALVSFDDLPLGITCSASGKAFRESDNKLLYGGSGQPFTVVRFTSATLALKRYYYITFNLNGGTWTSAEPSEENSRYQKGGPIELPTSSDAQKNGQIFAGWWTSSDGGTTLDQKFKFTEETKGDYALYAKWVENGIGGITVTIYSETNDLDLTVEPFTESGGGYKFTATPPEEGEYTYAWYVDGVSESDAGSTENEFMFRKVNGDGSLVVKGVYDIKVEVKKSGSTKWSAFAQAKVE